MSKSNLGPLSFLVGVWEGNKGFDVAPADNRDVENNKFRERITFEDIGLINNHEQSLYGLRYHNLAWEEGKDEHPFHEEIGYWLWDADNLQVMKCFTIPRGVSVLAGGSAAEDATTYTMQAELGNSDYGINSNKFLDQEFKTVKYTVKITKINNNSYSYESDTQLLMKGRTDIFHHTDRNILTRVN